MATILEKLQEKYPNAEGINDARNIAEAVDAINGEGGRGANAIVDSLYKDEYFTYDPNGGEGERFREYHFKDAASVTFPECPFTPPEGKVFQDWYIIDEEHETEDHIGPGARDYAGIGNKTVYASWTDAE